MIMNKSRKQYLRIKKPIKKNAKIGEGIVVVSDGKVHGGDIGLICWASEPSDGVIGVIIGNNLPVAK
ncbi:hypothetical protein M6B09_003798 [Salmonella enterica]|uniref:hypothetical protein n=1 Tax=Salmonella sp. 741265120_PSA TaxID=3389040 RepID=UPI000E078613|nr:hypothetical protein [Salmonella enterica]EHL4285017.1 hypothetical protein [Salmonella enterica subsp. enterica serovar Orientalis]EHP4800099.1 hypothetical protein [Salmonella enterica subsp. enterica serovar Sangera]EHW8658258.1 hypothetical protein [Salmonella enterica subsp. enterica serovar Duisburg]EHB5896453.1 hypothetical protein [Salmonella enterica]